MDDGSSGPVEVSRTKAGPPPPDSAARAASSSGVGSEDGLRGRWVRKLPELGSGAMTARAAAEARVWEGSNSVTYCWAGAGAERRSASSSSAAAAWRAGGLGGRCFEEEKENESFFSFSIAVAAATAASDPGKMQVCLVEPWRKLEARGVPDLSRGLSGPSGGLISCGLLSRGRVGDGARVRVDDLGRPHQRRERFGP